MFTHYEQNDKDFGHLSCIVIVIILSGRVHRPLTPAERALREVHNYNCVDHLLPFPLSQAVMFLLAIGRNNEDVSAAMLECLTQAYRQCGSDQKF